MTTRFRKLLNNEKIQSIQEQLENLTPTEATDYLLWKTTEKLKKIQENILPIRKNGCYGQRQIKKFQAFAEHLTNVCEHLPSEMSYNEERSYLIFWNSKPTGTSRKAFQTAQIKDMIPKYLSYKNYKPSCLNLITRQCPQT